jgi:(1->4)-alpha-D-glucan 1-alpha-D-glucosylmutase
VRGVLGDAEIRAEVEAFVERLAPAWQATALAQKAVQLTMPGVADTYQGTELWDLSLVDPDNRRPVDYALRASLLQGLSGPPPVDGTGAAKLYLVATLLRLRRDDPDAFLAGSSYEPVDAGSRAVAFARAGRVVTVAPTRALQVERTGWADDVVQLPAGSWVDVLTGGESAGGPQPLAALLRDFPVAVLRRLD